MKSRFRWAMSRDPSLLVIGRFVSMTGTGMAPICLAAAALRSSNFGAAGLAVAVGAFGIGQFAFTLLGGIAADRIGARAAMMCGDGIAFAAELGIGILFAVGIARIVTVGGLSVLLGLGAALSNPASMAVVRHVSSDDQLVVLNRRIRVAGVVARIIGAPLGGVVASIGSPSNGIIIDAATFLCSASVGSSSLQPMPRSE